MKRADIDELRPEYRREDLGLVSEVSIWKPFRLGQIWSYSTLTLQRHFPRMSR